VRIEERTRVLIHDDLLATGRTAEAAGNLIKHPRGVIVGFSILINLIFLPGLENLKARFGVNPYYLAEY
jgi:adenine phosphoribosyltransferase